MDNKENEKQAKLKEFQRRFPNYMNGKKVIFPIMDEIIVQFSQIFPQSNQFGKMREGNVIKTFSPIPLNQQIEITTFINAFPYNQQFAAMSDSQNQFQLLLSPLLKLTGHLIKDYHTNATFSNSYQYSTFDTQEQSDRINFKLTAFIIEDIFKYKMGLLKPIDIAKQRQVKDEMKKKGNKAQKISLLSMVEKQQQQEEEKDINQDLTLQSQKYEFENYLDPTCQSFWKIAYEAFNKIIKKSQRTKLQDMDIEQDSDEQPDTIQNVNNQKGNLNQESVELRRQQIISKYQQLGKLKDQNKKKSKSTKQYTQIKSFKIKDKYTDLEMLRFNNLFKFLIQNWPAMLLQSIKLPYVQSLFTDQELRNIKSIGQNDLGYFGLKAKQRADITSNLIEGVRETDSFKIIIEYRQEVTEAVGLVLENVQDELNSINQALQKKDSQYTQQQQQQYRKIYKQYLQLVEFSRLFINGCLYLGSDIHGYDYHIFSNDIDHIYQNNGSEWRVLDENQVQQLFKTLNVCGVKERELQTNIQKLMACELFNDQDTKELITIKNVEQSQVQAGNRSPKQLIVKILLEVVQKYTDVLMIRKLRWESYKIREKFQNTIKTLENPLDMVDFMKILIEQFETAQVLVIDQQKMQNGNQYDQKDLKEFQQRIRIYENKLQGLKEPEKILFYDSQLFQMMESKEYIKPNGIKSNTKFWQQSLGLDVKEALMNFANKVDKENQQYDVVFMASTLLLAVQEYELSSSSQDNEDDEVLRQIVKEVKFDNQNSLFKTDNHQLNNQIIELD
ncbi:unnamed protein product [Paramecium octaurelia]|uniref:Uncharacterized protein n=1 Tax=Paramecium octaurelia TaxID=43137 RepID=A0A8S1TDY2_PAROT|nr:unnamed protein product [Paramecium octaurelia]